MQATYVRQPSQPRSAFNDDAAPRGTEGRRRQPASAFKRRGNVVSGPADRALIEALVNSKLFQEYERAFNEATGLPVALRPVESWQLPHHGKRNEGPFCAIISEKSRACASCLSMQEKLSELAVDGARTLGCPNGLCDTAVPVHL